MVQPSRLVKSRVRSAVDLWVVHVRRATPASVAASQQRFIHSKACRSALAALAACTCAAVGAINNYKLITKLSRFFKSSSKLIISFYSNYPCIINTRPILGRRLGPWFAFAAARPLN